jgi:membrane-anchored mycosin MYCP
VTTIGSNVRPAGGWRSIVSRIAAVALGVGSLTVLTAVPMAAYAAPAPPPGLGGAARAAGADNCSTPSNDMVRDIPWTQKRLDLPRVWDVTTGEGVTVAVIDTGVDGKVPQLAGHVLPGTDVINGRGRADTDCFGHGTFVAGLIAAQRRAETGMAGIAPGVMILPIRQATSAADGSAAGLARSIRVAVDGGAKVINISASVFFPNADLEAAVHYATSRNVLLVASASNEAQQGNPTAYPAAYPEVVAVGAIGQDGKRTEFSEVGDYLDLVAPGKDVISLSRGGQGQFTDSGTSYATPMVTATAALVRAYHPDLTAAQVKRRMEVTADHPAATLPDPQVGWGVVNPYNAVTAVVPEEFGFVAKPNRNRPLDPLSRPVANHSGRETALTFAGGAVLVVLLIAVFAYVLPRGMRRDWRPAGEVGDSGRRDNRSRAAGESTSRAGRG